MSLKVGDYVVQKGNGIGGPVMRIIAFIGNVATVEGRTTPGSLGNVGGTEDLIWNGEWKVASLHRLPPDHDAVKDGYCFEEF